MDESKSPTFSLQATWLGISVGAGFALGYAKAHKSHLLGGFFVPAVLAPDGHFQPVAKTRRKYPDSRLAGPRNGGQVCRSLAAVPVGENFWPHRAGNRFLDHSPVGWAN